MEDTEIIFKYTREDAIRDGVLTVVPANLVREVGFKIPIAYTMGVQALVDPEIMPTGESVEGRLWDVLFCLMAAARTRQDGSAVKFEVLFRFREARYEFNEEEGLPNWKYFDVERVHELKAEIGPGDKGEPVITIMLPGED